MVVCSVDRFVSYPLGYIPVLARTARKHHDRRVAVILYTAERRRRYFVPTRFIRGIIRHVIRVRAAVTAYATVLKAVLAIDVFKSFVLRSQRSVNVKAFFSQRRYERALRRHGIDVPRSRTAENVFSARGRHTEQANFRALGKRKSVVVVP